jgi:hypothetical protein
MSCRPTALATPPPRPEQLGPAFGLATKALAEWRNAMIRNWLDDCEHCWAGNAWPWLRAIDRAARPAL